MHALKGISKQVIRKVIQSLLDLRHNEQQSSHRWDAIYAEMKLPDFGMTISLKVSGHRKQFIQFFPAVTKNSLSGEQKDEQSTKIP